MMEMQTVLEAADAIKRLKMYPYFDVAHYILNCMAVREDTYPQQPTGTRSVRVVCLTYKQCNIKQCCQ